MYTLARETRISPNRIVREVIKEDKALFGLLTFRRVESATTIGDLLHIETGKTPQKVYLNGVEYIPNI